MTTYYITRSRYGREPLKVEIEGVPPCLYCAEPVHSPSCDGPLVCALCDMGSNRDGSKWTEEQSEERHAHFRKVIAEYLAKEQQA